MSNTQYGKVGNGKKFHVVEDNAAICNRKEVSEIVSEVESDQICKRCQTKVAKTESSASKEATKKVAKKVSNKDKASIKAIEKDYLMMIADYATMTMGKTKEFIKNSKEIAQLKEYKDSLRKKLESMGWKSHKHGF